MYSYQIKTLRYVHDTFTGEFLNIGIVLFAKDARFFRGKLLHNCQRITGAFPNADTDHLLKYFINLQAKFDSLAECISAAWVPPGTFPHKTIDDLLHAALPLDDSSLQAGPTQGGMADDLDQAHHDLFYRLVKIYAPLGGD